MLLSSHFFAATNVEQVNKIQFIRYCCSYWPLRSSWRERKCKRNLINGWNDEKKKIENKKQTHQQRKKLVRWFTQYLLELVQTCQNNIFCFCSRPFFILDRKMVYIRFSTPRLMYSVKLSYIRLHASIGHIFHALFRQNNIIYGLSLDWNKSLCKLPIYSICAHTCNFLPFFCFLTVYETKKKVIRLYLHNLRFILFGE